MDRNPSLRSVATRIAASSTLATALLGASAAADATEVRILSAAAMKPVFNEIVPDFERMSGHKLVIDYATIGGVSQQLLAGAVADVVIGSTLSMPALVKAGKIAAGSQVTICKVGVGVVVRAGSPKPRIDSIEDLKRALLAAKFVVYADPVRGGAAGVHVATVTEKLGIAEQLRPKLRLGAGGDITEVTVAQGEGAIGLTQISEIVGKPAAQLVGPLLAELQNYTVFVAGIPTGAKQSDATAAVIKLLKSPAAIAAMKDKGMEVD
jgi:molybdate transport system substrate-binding protein